MRVETLKIGFITYSMPHLKTEQLLFNYLSRKTGDELRIYGLPFLPRKKREPQFNHRPDHAASVHPKFLADYYNVAYKECQSDLDIDADCDYYIICNGKLLSSEFIQNKKVINAHAGVIPCARGLDAFKWSIYNNVPLGITLHYIDAEIDAGEIISIIATPVFSSDTIEILARRHYENEVAVLSNFDRFIEQPTMDLANLPATEAARRMPAEIEKQMLAGFSDYVQNNAIIEHNATANI